MISSKKKFHFIGIGGSGMSGVAQICLAQGHSVSGSDLRQSVATTRLQNKGAIISFPHSHSNIKESPVVVISSAIPESNEELSFARQQGLPIMKRAEVLGDFMQGREGIAVAGCHGKTSTTSLVSNILTVAGMDPTTVVGGEASHVGGNAKFGQGKYLVAEADESDGSFLYLPSKYSIITNIDNDHLDHYGSFENILQHFMKFANQTERKVVMCGEDSHLSFMAEQLGDKAVTYGVGLGYDFSACDVSMDSDGTRLSVFKNGEFYSELHLPIPGRHVVLNSLAALALCDCIGVATESVVRGLQTFQGVQRRFEKVAHIEGVDVYDDYAHHPSEVSATLQAARQLMSSRDGKLVVCFQPHRYSRLRHLMDEFANSFVEADFLYLMPVYAAGEAPMSGVDHWSLYSALNMDSDKVSLFESSDIKQCREQILSEMKSGDILLTMGAGDITRLGREIITDE